MNDMSSVIVPKSDQINADDLIAGPMTITIRDVQIKGGQEQPVSIYFDGSEKAFRPCKSMSRVLVQAWGADAKAYIGRSLALYRDPTVKWGGLEVGGIRISHMSDIDGVKQMMLTATKGSRKPHRVMPLVMQRQRQAPAATEDAATRWANGYVAKLGTFTTLEAVKAFANEKSAKLAELATARPDLHDKVSQALADRSAELSPQASSFDDDDFGTQNNEEASGTVRETPGAEESTSTTSVDDGASSTGPASVAEEPVQAQPETDEPHPAIAKADEIIGEIRSAAAIMDVNSIMSRNRLDVAAMPEPIAEAIQNAADQRKDAIKAEREKAGVAA